MATPTNLQSDVHQRHHDTYVRKARLGALTDEDQAQYDLAIERERNGDVKPLPEDDQSKETEE
jgi:hypothetical protein